MTLNCRFRRFGALVSITIGMTAAGCSDGTSHDASRPIVNFYNWFDYIDPATLPAFTQETGIKVNYETFESDETLEAKLLAGHSGYDVVVPSSAYFARQIAAGVFHQIDRNRLHNYRELDPFVLSKLAVADPDNRYGVPHAWGTTGLGLNVAQIQARMPDAPLDSWSLIFDPDIARRFRDCGVVMLDSAGDVVPSVLLYLGRDPASRSPVDLEDAIAVVARVQPFIRYFHNSQSTDDLANGEICLALGWSGALFQSIRTSPSLNLRYVIPKEGAAIWFDVMAIPADAHNVDNAYRLIDYMLDPRVAAGFTNTMFYPSGVSTGLDSVNRDVRSEEAVYPSKTSMQRLHASPPETPEYERRRLRLWTLMKAGQPALASDRVD